MTVETVIGCILGLSLSLGIGGVLYCSAFRLGMDYVHRLWMEDRAEWDRIAKLLIPGWEAANHTVSRAIDRKDSTHD